MRLEDLDDGSKLEAAWHDALSGSLTYFRALLASSNSSSWKKIPVLPLTASTVARDTGESSSQATSLGRIHPSDVAVHRRSGKAGEVFRAVVEVDCGDDVSVDTFRSCLMTPETRPTWDRMVEEAVTLDLLDAHTRVTKTNYRLGWPSSPRDVVTISKTLVDPTTLIDISTSLPRSRHEPAYLRPAPPHVRAHVSLLAWCIQLPSPSGSSDLSPPEGKARITCFWSWNPKGAWAVGGGVPQHMPSLVTGLVDYVREGSEKVPVLLDFGSDVSIGNAHYDAARIMLSVGYAIVSGPANAQTESSQRQVEFGISSTQSWDVQISVNTQSGDDSSSTAWTPTVSQASPAVPGHRVPQRYVLRFAHAALDATEELIRVRVSIERTSASAWAGVRINGIPVIIETMEHRLNVKRPLLEDTASTSGISLRTMSTVESVSIPEPSSERHKTEPSRYMSADRSIASLTKRNYICKSSVTDKGLTPDFTSLLQEPEAKWRPVVESRGVAVHQLDSIDKTLFVFRAEAVFVGVGIWDLFATIASPGGRLVWDKMHDDAALIEDINELTDLWHFKSRAAWPVAARDSVMLRTTYKSPSSVHIFGFSVDDTELFPGIPPSIDPTVIRTQIDLQGWSIEALSPNTTQVTLLEQSDPRGWSNKSSIPQIMLSTLSSIGEFAIKHGAPPATTRLGGAKALASRYDLEKETFRFEYELAEARRTTSSSTSTAFPLSVAVKSGDDGSSEVGSLKSFEHGMRDVPNVECEIRCDPDQWANSYTIVVDPPQKSISALKRHKLSPNGGGLWLTIEHDLRTVGKGRVVITIRRGLPAPNGKTIVTVNGSKIKLDVEDLPEADAKLLQKQKRARPTRAPLDQPPALGSLRKRHSSYSVNSGDISPSIDRHKTVKASMYTRYAPPLARWYSVAAESTRAAIIPMSAPTPTAPSGRTPVDAAVRALSQLARMHAERDGESTDPNAWQSVHEKDGLRIERRVVSQVSDVFPVYRAGRIIEGFTAEEVSAVVSSLRSDDRFGKPIRLESYGHGMIVSHLTAHTTFAFRARSLVAASVIARLPDGPPPSPSMGHGLAVSTILHATSSLFDSSTLQLDPFKYNPAQLPSGNVILEGWILETIDPYSHEHYAIPSTRCMYVAAIDYSGNMPLSVNNMLNASLPRILTTVASSLKTEGPPSRARTPIMSVSAPDQPGQEPWSLRGVDISRQGVDEYNDATDYALTVTLQPAAPGSRDSDYLSPLSPQLRHTESRSSVQSSRSTVIDLGEDIRGARPDLIVFEVDIASSMAKRGAEIRLEAVSLPIGQNVSVGESSVLNLSLSSPTLELPFKLAVVSLSPSVLHSASLDPSNASRHLLRVTLPSSGYELPIADPLTGKTAPLPRPRWLLDLIADGAVIHLSLKTKAEGPASYIYAGAEVPVEDERRAQRSGWKDSSKARPPQLVSRVTPNSISLDKPLAIAREFLADPVAPPTTILQPRAVVITASVSAAKSGDSIPEVKPTDFAKLPKPPGPVKRYSFWQYPYSRFGRQNTAPLSAKSSSPTKPTSQLEHAVPLPPPPSPRSTITAIATDRERLLRPITSLPGLIIACLACLLIGSLLRSLLSDADYVIYAPTGESVPLGETWRELRRLAGWRIGWDRDLIVAITRRRV